ncbi:MAG: hypothetical protein R2861_01215 [Desulfobacterales bacterium]
MIEIDREKMIHGREIAIATYAHDKDAVVVEGRLTDNRHVTTYYFSDGQSLAPGSGPWPGDPHGCQGPGLQIEAIDADMDTVPREDCREIKDALKKSDRHENSGRIYRARQGTGRRCQGMHPLGGAAAVMAPAVVQGAWSAVAGGSL